MATWLLVWFLVAIASTVAVLAVLVALVRHVQVVGRAAREMREAVGPLADEVAREGQRASTRAATIQPPGGRRSPGRR